MGVCFCGADLVVRGRGGAVSEPRAGAANVHGATGFRDGSLDGGPVVGPELGPSLVSSPLVGTVTARCGLVLEEPAGGACVRGHAQDSTRRCWWPLPTKPGLC